MIRRLGNIGIVEMGQHGMAVVEITGATKLAQHGIFPLNKRVWEEEPMEVGGFKIIPFGDQNNLPIELREIFDENNLAEGIFNRKQGLLWGQGPDLYKIEKKAGERSIVWVEDKEIESWLKTWDHEQYIQKCAVDCIHSQGVFTKLITNRAGRIGEKSKIAKLEHVSVAKARLEWPEDGMNSKNIIVGNWNTQDLRSLKPYPVFDKNNPFANKISMLYSNMYSFAREGYTIPSFYGSRHWIKLSSSLAILLMAYNVNAAAITYHITSPQSYWDAKEAKLRENCALKGEQYNDKMLDDLKDATFKKFTDTLTGVENAGKFLTTDSYFNDEANDFEGWKIEPIDQKIKDYVDAQIAIANKADSATTSGLGLHPSLSNIMVDGKLASGSEQLYALKLYLATETDIPSSIIFRAINLAIEINFPGKDIKMGFYHDVVKTEDSVSPQNRVKNVV